LEKNITSTTIIKKNISRMRFGGTFRRAAIDENSFSGMDLVKMLIGRQGAKLDAVALDKARASAFGLKAKRARAPPLSSSSPSGLREPEPDPYLAVEQAVPYTIETIFTMQNVAAFCPTGS
jgi:hypothetical protein